MKQPVRIEEEEAFYTAWSELVKKQGRKAPIPSQEQERDSFRKGVKLSGLEDIVQKKLSKSQKREQQIDRRIVCCYYVLLFTLRSPPLGRG